MDEKKDFVDLLALEIGAIDGNQILISKQDIYQTWQSLRTKRYGLVKVVNNKFVVILRCVQTRAYIEESMDRSVRGLSIEKAIKKSPHILSELSTYIPCRYRAITGYGAASFPRIPTNPVEF